MMAKVIRGLKELLPYARSDSIGIPCSKMLQSMLKIVHDARSQREITLSQTQYWVL